MRARHLPSPPLGFCLARPLVVGPLLLGLLSGCREPAPPPTCELEPFAAEHLPADAVDCGEADLEVDRHGQTRLTDCAVEAMDAGRAFTFRTTVLRRHDFEQPPFEPYRVWEVLSGDADGGVVLFHDTPLGGRVLLNRCAGWDAREYGEGRYLACRYGPGTQELCNHTFENQQAGKQWPEP